MGADELGAESQRVLEVLDPFFRPAAPHPERAKIGVQIRIVGLRAHRGFDKLARFVDLLVGERDDCPHAHSNQR